VVIRSKHIPYTEEELKNELWKPVLGYKGYEASNIGRLRVITGGLLKTSLDPDGYVNATLTSDTLARNPRKVHRMVALAWIPNPENKPTVNHEDGNKQNNRIWNLAWNTRKENTNHAVDSGLWTNSAIVTVKDILDNTEKTFMSISRMSKYLNVNPLAIVSHIKHSDKYPILNRYIISLKDKFVLGPVNTSGKAAVEMWVYDVLDETWTMYNSMMLVSYNTGMSIGYLSKFLNRDGYIYTMGYLVTPTMDVTKIPNSVNKEEVILARETWLSKPYIKRDHFYYLYDYTLKEEIVLNTIDEVSDFLLTKEPVSNQVNNHRISTALAKSSTCNESWIIKGYGIKSSVNDFTWKNYTEEEVVNSRYNVDISAATYEVIDSNREEGKQVFYVFGNFRLAMYLGVFKDAGNPRSNINSYLLRHSLEELVSLSDHPHIKIRRLEHKTIKNKI
jgi:hypothetical protein